eukprot:scaffold3342_cov186-Alexandrium_tamarense.AAC.3
MPSLSMITSASTDDAFTAMSALDVADRLSTMQYQESTTYATSNYINDNTADDAIVDKECRVKMSGWTYQVVDFCKFKRSTVAISMSYMDRFLSTDSPSARKGLRDKKVFQLVSMTCLYLAVKLVEPMAMDPSMLAAISHGCYTEDDIEYMEQEILSALKWRVNGPTGHDFASHLLTFIQSENTSSSLVDLTTFQVELSVMDYDLSMQKPSVVAMAAILNSVEGISEKQLSAKARFAFLETIATETDMDAFSPEVNAARIRLLNLFKHSSGYELKQVANLTPIICVEKELQSSRIPKEEAGSTSPVCVGKFPRRGSLARCA